MMPHHRSTVVPALVAGLALFGSVAHPATAQQQIGMGRPVTGTLTTADPVLPSDHSHYKLFSFYGTAGQTVQIDLTSGDFDSRLYLQDWEGQNIAEDGDSGGARNARIWYNLPFTGMYQILANARRADQHGAFTVSVVATVGHAMPPNVNPPQLVTIGTIGLNQQVQGTLADTSPTYGQKKYHAYDFQCSAGQQFQMDILSDWDNYAMVIDPGGNIVSRDNDSGGRTNARIVHTCATTGTYRLMVTTSSQWVSVGRYTMRVQAYGTPTPVLARSQPTAQPQPVAQAQPVARPQPVVQPQPVAPPQPVAQPQPAVQPQTIAQPKPVSPPQPVALTQPIAQTQPVVQAQSVAQPVAKPQPAAQPEPVAQSQPVVQSQPTAQAQPVLQPQPVAQPESVAQPQPVAPPPPAAQPQPVAQPQPTAQSQPVVQPQPVAPRQPAAQPQPVAQTQPAAQPVAVTPPPAPVEATPTGAIPAPGEIGQIAIGQTMRGRLEPGDQTMAGTFADTWQFQGSAGQTVTIDVKSTAFSTYVQLIDANGNRLAEDGGSGGNNSRLAFLLKSTGMYQIVVVSSEGQRATGVYTISIR